MNNNFNFKKKKEGIFFYLEQSAVAENNGNLILARPHKLGKALAFISLTGNFDAKNLKHLQRGFSSDLFAASLATSLRAEQQ